MSEELKPCPFCGNKDWKEIDHESINSARWMRCQKCSATCSWVWLERYPLRDTKDAEEFRLLTRSDTEKAWNTRPIEAALTAERDALYKTLENLFNACSQLTNEDMDLLEKEINAACVALVNYYHA